MDLKLQVNPLKHGILVDGKYTGMNVQHAVINLTTIKILKERKKVGMLNFN